ncbi:MAG: hypothetical protein LBE06_09135 [Azoarcus sp.]|jgi:hemolysin activation/secretion protein|nr:hypothetical protein [Azoarcus sp.]
MPGKIISFRHAVLLLGHVCFSLSAWAQVQAPPPDAGSILRETETLRPPPEPPRQESLPLPEQPPAAGAAVEGAEETLFIRAFRVEHPEPLAAAEVEAALAPYAGRHLTMAEIDAAVRAVTALYHAHGFYLAQANLPPQDARGGTLRIEVVIGRYGEVRLHNGTAVRDGLVRDIFAGVAAGEPARRETLEQALLLASDLPGIRLPEVSATPGKQAGTMDMDITLPPGKRFGGFAVYDNQGSRYTGRNRLGVWLNGYSPLGLGDTLSFSGIYGYGDARHTGSGSLMYALPVSPRLGAAVSAARSDYAMGDQYEALDATGTVDSVELEVRYAALRGQARNLALSARFASRRLRDDLGLFGLVTKKEMTSGVIGVRFEQWGQVFGRAARGVAALEYTGGRLHYEDEAQREENRRGANTEGDYRKLMLSGALDYALSRSWRLNAELAVQQALGKSLGGGEQLSIAGAGGVRAYRESISADSAYTVRVEARRALPAAAGVSHSVGVFADYGRGWFERPEYVTQNGVTAADVGIAYYAARAPFFVRAQVAHKVGARPDERLAKKDGDTHLLLQVGASF